MIHTLSFQFEMLFKEDISYFLMLRSILINGERDHILEMFSKEQTTLAAMVTPDMKKTFLKCI